MLAPYVSSIPSGHYYLGGTPYRSQGIDREPHPSNNDRWVPSSEYIHVFCCIEKRSSAGAAIPPLEDIAFLVHVFRRI